MQQMVASHVWDTIGAQAVGFSAGLITRPGNAPLPVSGVTAAGRRGARPAGTRGPMAAVPVGRVTETG